MRIKWIETLRVFAATIVFTSHFLHEFDRSLFDYVWQLGQNTTSSPMVGITGKFCVALFGVISGYLAARSASSQKTSKYILNRYVGFLIPILITNIIAIGVFYLKGYDIPPIKTCLIETFAFNGSTLNSVEWCMGSYFFGSIITFLLNKLHCRLSIQLIVAIFISLLDIWTGMIVMGGIVYNLVDTSSYSGDILKRFFEKRIRNFIKRPFISLIIIVFLYMVTKRQESAVTYLIDGIACTLLLLTISCSDMLIGFLEKFPFSKMGKYSFEFYLLQIIWYEAFRVIYYKLSLLLSNSWLFIIYFLFIVITLSIASLFVNKITIIMKQYLYNFMFPIENQNKTI